MAFQIKKKLTFKERKELALLLDKIKKMVLDQSISVRESSVSINQEILEDAYLNTGLIRHKLGNKKTVVAEIVFDKK